MHSIRNTRFLRALKKQNNDRTPIWIMRQAGRYLPEYRKVRAKAGDFLTLASTPELACEVTLQPLTRFRLDAAIIFSDILTVPDAMGLGLYFAEGEGPRFKNPARTPDDIKALHDPDPESELRYVMDAIRLTRTQLNDSVPLIGFCGSPWTVATYMIEGSGSKEYVYTKKLMYGDDAALHQLLTKVTVTSIAYLQAQVQAGAQSLMVFDTWGGILTPKAYKEFSLRYMQDIVNALTQSHPDIPVTLFTKNGGMWLPDIARTGCAAVGVDWTIDLRDARALTQDKVTLQGNLDPGVLYGSKKKIRQEVIRVLESYGACLLYTSPSPRDGLLSRMPSSA